MKYIDLTKNKRAIVDDNYYDAVSQYKWHYNDYYALRGRKPVVRMHRFIVELSGQIILPGMEVDHISRDKLDNRLENLRIGSSAQNSYNRAGWKNSKSGYKGVTWSNRHNKWRARIMVDGTSLHLGYFDNLVEATHTYDKAAKELYKEFAFTNHE